MKNCKWIEVHSWSLRWFAFVATHMASRPLMTENPLKQLHRILCTVFMFQRSNHWLQNNCHRFIHRRHSKRSKSNPATPTSEISQNKTYTRVYGEREREQKKLRQEFRSVYIPIKMGKNKMRSAILPKKNGIESQLANDGWNTINFLCTIRRTQANWNCCNASNSWFYFSARGRVRQQRESDWIDKGLWMNFAFFLCPDSVSFAVWVFISIFDIRLCAFHWAECWKFVNSCRKAPVHNESELRN